MPDITPAQIVAIVGWIVAQAVAYGLLSNEQSQLAISVGATVLASVLKIVDSYLRGKRNDAKATIALATNANTKA